MDKPVRRKSYFWRISVEAVINVVRHLSSRPRNANWAKWLNPGDLYALLKASESIAAAVGRALKCTGDLRTIVVDGDSAEQYWQLLRVIGPVFTELTVMDVMWPSRMRDSGIHKCASNLRCLRLRTYSLNRLSPILRACRSKLEKLELEGRVLEKEHVGAIATHCRGLKSLTLNYREVEKRLKKIWLTVGPTLTSLSLSHIEMWNVCEEEYEDLSPEIAWHCTNLTSLEFHRFNLKIRTSAERLCNLFGNQLQVLSLPKNRTDYLQWPSVHRIGPNCLRPILAACPNVVVDTWVEAWRSDELLVVKDRARKLRIDATRRLTENHNLDVLLQGSRDVTYLEQLEVLVDDGAGACRFLPTFFTTIKTHVRELILHFDEYWMPAGLVNFGEMFEALVNLIDTVEVLEYRNMPMFHCGMYRLAAANPGLASLKIECSGAAVVEQERVNHEQGVLETVDLFSRCPSLKEVVIWSNLLKVRSQRISDACVVLRNREVDVFVAGIQYAP